MRVNDYLKSLASMAGIPETDEQLTKLLADENLQKIEIEDGLASTINSKMLTIESAKNNSDLNKHFKAQVLNGLDAEITKLFDEVGIDAETKTQILAEASSFKRVPMLVKTVKELESKKAAGGDKAKLQSEIDALNKQILDITNKKQQEVESVNEQWRAKFIDQTLSGILAGYDYVAPVDKSINVLTAKTLFQNELTAKGLRVMDENGNLKLVNADGLDHYENNVKVNAKEFAEQLLVSNKMLKTNNGGTPTPTPTPNGGTPAKPSTDKFASRAAELAAEASK